MPSPIGNRLRLVARVLQELLGEELAVSVRGRRRQAAPVDGPGNEQRRARAVRQALERLGPFYVKLGQLLSTRPDMMPPAMIAELENLHDQVEVLPFSRLEPVLEHDLGPDWRRRFQDIDTAKPLGSASIAQAHRATLAGGRPVVIKIQRPGIRESVAADMALMRRAARLVGRTAPRFSAVVDLEAMLGGLFDAMEPELDFTGEAVNMDRARDAIRKYRSLAVPAVVHATPGVLVQSLAPGTSVRHADRAAFDPAQLERVSRDLLSFMYQGYFIDRTFHADPHPGNVFISPDGPATLIDWGMVGRLDKRASLHLVLVLMTVAEGDGYGLAKAWTEMGHATPWADLPGFAADMAALAPRIAGATLQELNFGAALTSVLEKASRRGIASAPSVSLLGKSFANLEGSIRCLHPDLALADAFRSEVNGILTHLVREYSSPQQLARNWTELLIGTTSSLEQLRSLANDLSNRTLSLQVQRPRLPRGLTADRPGVARSVLALAAAAYFMDRRRRDR
ncbi:ABC1 kinase family protein [Streptomyces sp. NPDC059255]|uniref:ABC1 kinase family protein n=1 Tax=Streptomyces sp. NPDC059255 TaxID=3346793 RepID=UPI0036C4F649